MAENPQRPQIETLHVLIKGLDEKFTLLLAEAEKRNSQRFDAQQAAVTAALNSAEKAVTKAEIASEKRFEGVNEFRQALSDQTSTFMTRAEYGVQHQALIEKIEGLTNRMVTTERRLDGMQERGSGRNDSWLIVATIAAILISIAAVAVHFVRP